MTAAQTFGLAVRAQRVQFGWSQRQLAVCMGTLGFSWHQTTVAKTEAAERSVPIDEAVALARLLRISLDSLLLAGAEL